MILYKVSFTDKSIDLNYLWIFQNDRLTEAFGSSRKQRALESRLRSAVTPKALETLANKAIEHAQTQPQSAYPSGKSPSDWSLPLGSLYIPCQTQQQA